MRPASAGRPQFEETGRGRLSGRMTGRPTSATARLYEGDATAGSLMAVSREDATGGRGGPAEGGFLPKPLREPKLNQAHHAQLPAAAPGAGARAAHDPRRRVVPRQWSRGCPCPTRT